MLPPRPGYWGMMSVDNVKQGLQNSVVQRNLAAHSRAVAAVVAREVPSEVLAPGFRLENRVTAVTDYTYQGETGWREWMSDLFEMFQEGAQYGEELIAAGEDFVAANFWVEGVGARSGTPIQFRWAGVTWFRDGKATLAVGYPTRRDALRAVGLGDPSRRADNGIRQARRIP